MNSSSRSTMAVDLRPLRAFGCPRNNHAAPRGGAATRPKDRAMHLEARPARLDTLRSDAARNSASVQRFTGLSTMDLSVDLSASKRRLGRSTSLSTEYPRGTPWWCCDPSAAYPRGSRGVAATRPRKPPRRWMRVGPQASPIRVKLFVHQLPKRTQRTRRRGRDAAATQTKDAGRAPGAVREARDSRRVDVRGFERLRDGVRVRAIQDRRRETAAEVVRQRVELRRVAADEPRHAAARDDALR